MHPIPAIFYDGHTAQPQPVTIYLHGDRLIVDGEQAARDEPLAGLEISEPLGAAPRVVRFSDGAHCEVREHAAFEQLLRTAGIDPVLSVRVVAGGAGRSRLGPAPRHL